MRLSVLGLGEWLEGEWMEGTTAAAREPINVAIGPGVLLPKDSLFLLPSRLPSRFTCEAAAATASCSLFSLFLKASLRALA